MIHERHVSLPGVGLRTRVLDSALAGGRADDVPVLLLHGSPDSATEWHGVIERLGPGYRTIAPDLPGLGACDEPDAAFSFARSNLVAFVDAVLDALNVREPVVLVVHDIGGIIGVPWAAQRLARVRGIVVTNTVAFEGFPWFPVARTWASDGTMGRLRANMGMAAIGLFGGGLFARAFGRASPELPAADLDRMRREFALDGKSKRSTLRLFREMLAPAFFDGVDEMRARLIAQRPVRVVWGRNDPYIPSRWAAAFEGATSLDVLGNHGHWTPITAAAEVAAAIRAIVGDR